MSKPTNGDFLQASFDIPLKEKEKEEIINLLGFFFQFYSVDI